MEFSTHPEVSFPLSEPSVFRHSLGANISQERETLELRGAYLSIIISSGPIMLKLAEGRRA